MSGLDQRGGFHVGDIQSIHGGHNELGRRDSREHQGRHAYRSDGRRSVGCYARDCERVRVHGQTSGRGSPKSNSRRYHLS